MQRFEHKLKVANAYKVSLSTVKFNDNSGKATDYTSAVEKEQVEPNLDFQRFLQKMFLTGNIQV